jgi:hypothetical protein
MLRRALAIVRRSGADAYPQQVRATQLHLAMVLRAKGNEVEAKQIEQEAAARSRNGTPRAMK